MWLSFVCQYHVPCQIQEPQQACPGQLCSGQAGGCPQPCAGKEQAATASRETKTHTRKVDVCLSVAPWPVFTNQESSDAFPENATSQTNSHSASGSV